jgi:hypothetical protein
MQECLPPLLDAYKMGLESGDIEYALLSSTMYSFHWIDVSQSILDVERKIAEFTKAMQMHEHELSLVIMQNFGPMIRSMIGSADYKDVLQIFSQQEGDLGTRDDFTVVVLNLFGNLEVAERLSVQCFHKFKNIPVETFEICQIEAFISIVSITAIKENHCKAASRRFHMKIVRGIEKRLRKWVKLNPI